MKETTITFYSAIMRYVIIKSDSEVMLHILSSKGKIIVFAEEANANTGTLEVRTQEVRTQDTQTHSNLINQRRSRKTQHNTTNISEETRDSNRLKDLLQRVHAWNKRVRTINIALLLGIYSVSKNSARSTNSESFEDRIDGET